MAAVAREAANAVTRRKPPPLPDTKGEAAGEANREEEDNWWEREAEAYHSSAEARQRAGSPSRSPSSFRARASTSSSASSRPQPPPPPPKGKQPPPPPPPRRATLPPASGPSATLASSIRAANKQARPPDPLAAPGPAKYLIPAEAVARALSSLGSMDSLLALEGEAGGREANVAALFRQMRVHAERLRAVLTSEAVPAPAPPPRAGGLHARRPSFSGVAPLVSADEPGSPGWRPPLPPGPRPAPVQEEPPLGRHSDVDTLLRHDPSITWNFNNETVMAYRAAASRFDHAAHTDSSWRAPAFTSSRPLPELERGLMCVVRLPEPGDESAPAEAKATTATTVAAAVAADSMTHTRVPMSESDTAAQVITRVLRKCRARLGADQFGDDAAYVLKAGGLNEYMRGDAPLLTSAYVRDCVRDRVSPSLAIVAPPGDGPGNDTASDDFQVPPARPYSQLVNPALRPLVGEDSPENVGMVTRAERWDPAAAHLARAVPLREMGHERFRVMVRGVDGCTARMLPALAEVPAERLYVKTFLFHGTCVLGRSIRVTPAAAYSRSPRWNHWCAAPPADQACDPPLDTLPREARLAVLLYGASADGGSARLLGWACVQLVDEFGRLASGPRALRLWPAADAETGDRPQDIAAALAAEPAAAALGGSASVLAVETAAGGGDGEDGDVKEAAAVTAGDGADAGGETRAPRQSVSESDPAAAPAASPDDPLECPDADEDGSYAHLLRDILAGTTRPNLARAASCTLHVEFPQFSLPVEAPLVLPPPSGGDGGAQVGTALRVKHLNDAIRARVCELRAADPLHRLSYDDRVLLWQARHLLVDTPSVLPRFLSAVDWGRPAHVREAHRLLGQWAAWEDPAAALELLGPAHADYVVRRHAVQSLEALDDREVCLYMLQLVQCLRFEPYHDSPLVRFLMRRALRSPLLVGHALFWNLRSAMHEAAVSERYSLVLEEYLAHSPEHAAGLRRQYVAVRRLQEACEMIVALKRDPDVSGAEIMERYRSALGRLNRRFFGPVGRFQLPLDPRLVVGRLRVERCKYMTSKKVPLWLEFDNAADPDGAPVRVIFKSGDDLRQDILTLQLLRVMDDVWLRAGLDLRMKPYGCLATGVNDDGEGVGMIEVVANAVTKGEIQRTYGGRRGAFKQDVIDRFLQEHNKGADVLGQARDNFVRSCAGYAVATYVLGLGDRHSDNIMVTRDGHLFHIDFGHFLGNFKSKFGIKREREAFVFTPAMAFAMGGREDARFRAFVRLCLDAFLALRKNAPRLLALFSLMVHAGMPELRGTGDVGFLRDKLMLDEDDRAAEQRFKDEINRSLDTKSRRLDDFFHDLRQFS